MKQSSNENPLVSQNHNDLYNQFTAEKQRAYMTKEEGKNQSPYSQAASMRSELSSTSSIYHENKLNLSKHQVILIGRFSEQLVKTGVKKILELRTKFREQDKRSSGTLNFGAFSDAIRSQKINVEDVDIKNAFKSFD
mmetsp:Transcript_16928/g.16168  ORF Transcript_16928/g.16168 Transcript_16928/m.16168 type:complete len:137 (+) Transcript_16928:1133-1543(+)